MHNDLAWAVLGVQPSISAAIEGAAKERGLPTGQFLERILAEAQSAVDEKAAAALAVDQRNERLSDLICSMADSLMSAADLVKKGPARREVRAVSIDSELQSNEPQLAIERSIEPQVLAPEESSTSGPSADQLRTWMRASDEQALTASRPKLLRRLRLSA